MEFYKLGRNNKHRSIFTLMKYKVEVLVGKTFSFEVESADEEEAEADAVALATEKFESEGIKDPDFEIDSVVEVDEDEEVEEDESEEKDMEDFE